MLLRAQVTVDNISAALQGCGYQSRGWEVMYNGHTGRQLQARIFLNPTYYQRLKHMVRALMPCPLVMPDALPISHAWEPPSTPPTTSASSTWCAPLLPYRNQFAGPSLVGRCQIPDWYRTHSLTSNCRT